MYIELDLDALKQEFAQAFEREEELERELFRVRTLKSGLLEKIRGESDFQRGDCVKLTGGRSPVLGGGKYADQYEEDFFYISFLKPQVKESGEVKLWAVLCTPNDEGGMPDKSHRHEIDKKYVIDVLEHYDPEEAIDHD